MPITVENTPNPMARKFTVGSPVGGPATYRDASAADEPYASILRIDGVASLFITADFVTVTRTPAGDWGQLTGPITEALEKSFG